MTDKPEDKPVPIHLVGSPAVGDALGGAEEYSPPADPPEAEDAGAEKPEWPIECLGINGDMYYYLDANRQLRPYHFKDHQRLGVLSLFGAFHGRLYDLWPKRDREGNVVGVENDKASRDLMGECARRGVWRPLEHVRGAGAWRGAHGELVLHCGDTVWIGPDPALGGAEAGAWRSPGMIGDFVYPAEPPGQRFSAEPAAPGEPGPAAMVIKLFDTWNFARGDLDNMLLLGWLGAAMVGGALDWRPLAWLTGKAGTGKSTCQKLIHLLLGGNLVAVSDATAAGIWQKVGHSSVPVVVDELEEETDNRKQIAVIKLARQASSGGVVLRGGKDHQGTEFTARSCFLFSAVDIPPLEVQDMQRMAIIDLGDLHAVDGPLRLDAEAMGRLGRQLRRRMVDGWPRFDDTLGRFQSALSDVGHATRGCAQFGTLLACADLLLNDGMPDMDSVAALAEKLRPENVAEIQDAGSGEDRCATWLLSSVIDPYRHGNRRTVGEWIMLAGDLAPTELNEDLTAAKILGTFGLKVKEKAGVKYLVIANFHRGLADLYRDSPWPARGRSMGGWVRNWRRMEGAQWTGDFNRVVYFSGSYHKAVYVPLETILPGAKEAMRAGGRLDLDEGDG